MAQDPAPAVMDLIFGRWKSQILYAGVRLGIFETLGEQPLEASDVAGRLGLDPSLAYRLMRSLGSLGLLTESSGRAFTITDAGRLLRADHPRTLRGVTLLEEGPEHYALWKHLCAMVRDGKQNAFVREFGRMAFDHAAANPEYAEVFNAAMSSYSSSQRDWVLEALASFDFSALKRICDIGGGQGFMLSSVLARYPHLSGAVLELPSVIEDKTTLWAGRMGIEERCEYIAGSMFDDVPEADAYLIKLILHDWNDEECIRILSNMHRRASEGGVVFVIEHVVPGLEAPHFSKFFDIHMMCWGTGRERTEHEYRALLEKAGWRFERIRYPSAGPIAVVEGSKS